MLHFYSGSGTVKQNTHYKLLAKSKAQTVSVTKKNKAFEKNKPNQTNKKVCLWSNNRHFLRSLHLHSWFITFWSLLKKKKMFLSRILNITWIYSTSGKNCDGKSLRSSCYGKCSLKLLLGWPCDSYKYFLVRCSF